jgi:RHS repeat-associated protein
MVYDYDLISGKVNQVAYQPGFTDEFYHRYTYDAENRVTDVETSHDGWLWEKDARYSYYKHGPLARTILRQQQVQGVDYAYTLQGWLKGVNSTTVNDGTYDMGGDGKTGAGLNPVARDAFGFSLNYFSNDYKPVGGTNPFAVIAAPTSISTSGQELFNGNIGAMAVNIPKLGDALLYRYRYDQLNRIVAMDAFAGLNSSTNAWTPSATDNYKERISYDPNGNILTYLRNGTTAGGNPLTMDNMTYGYNLSGGKLVNNRLRHVKDAVSSGNYSEDIDNQGDDNYTYDAIGNLTGDAAEGISNITWNVYGKISSITKSASTISYGYDIAGNRITKAVTAGGNTKTTVYVRDASGNVMSLYEQATTSNPLMQAEAHLYGSNRLGVYNVNRNVNSIMATSHLDNIATSIRGNKFFELGNHLGNVLATISDTKTEVEGNTVGLVDYYIPNVINANDYYPFGMTMPVRKFTANNNYRYGFNGKENDNDGVVQYDYGFRIYDPRLARFKSIDPLTKNYPSYSPYPFAMNNSIAGIDLDGLEFLHSSEARIEIVKGSVKLKIANMHWTTRRDFNAANRDPNNWSYGPDGKKGIGINTEIGSFSLQTIPTKTTDIGNATDNTYGAPDPTFKPGEVPIKSPTAKSTGLPDRRYKDRGSIQTAPPANARGLAVASVVVDAIILGNDYLTSHFANDDIDLAKQHAQKAAMALYDVNTALQEGLIDTKYQNIESLSDIANVVLSGVSNSGNKEIIDLGKKIYKEISTRRERFIGPVRIITGPSGVQIGSYRDPNPNYDPNYGKNSASSAQSAATEKGG